MFLLVLAYPGSPGTKAIKWLCVCVYYHYYYLIVWRQSVVTPPRRTHVFLLSHLGNKMEWKLKEVKVLIIWIRAVITGG